MRKKLLTNAISKLKGIKNEVNEDAKALIDAVIEGLNAMLEDPETTFSLEDVKNELLAMVNANEEVPAAVAEQIAQIKSLCNGLKAGATDKKISDGVREQVLNALMSRNRSREDVKNAVERIMKENDIAGIPYQDVIDYTIATDWLEDENPLWKSLTKTPFTKFLYSLKDDAEDIEAHLHVKLTEKQIQEFETKGKTLVPEYIYKRQRIAQQDLDALESIGEKAALVEFITKELVSRVHSAFINAMLGLRTDLTNVESLVGDYDEFRLHESGVEQLEIPEWRKAIDKIYNPSNKPITLITTAANLTELSIMSYGTGSTRTIIKESDIAEMLGVAEIVKVKQLPTKDAEGNVVFGIAFIPEEYHVHTRKTQNVAWMEYANNAANWMYEENIAGAIHGLGSVVVLTD